MSSDPPAKRRRSPKRRCISRRVQILATEHWSLLATRSMTWNEIFSRTGTFLTVLSGAVVTIYLVPKATGFGVGFRAFALVVLPVVLLVGLATYLRLIEAEIEDAWLVVGMNRLRHAYIDLEPELEQYFVASHHDDFLGILQTYGSAAKSASVTYSLVLRSSSALSTPY